MTNLSESRECDLEPIRIPGAIQPHGALVALDAHSLEIIRVSANCFEFLGVTPASLVGRPFSELGGNATDVLRATLRSTQLTSAESLLVEVNQRVFDVRAHQHEGVAILEFERHDPAASATDARLRSALARLQRPTTAGDIGAIAVEEIRNLTGFDRVLLYQFDDDGHGNVTQEAKADGVDAYWGLRFPASDIPAQARELYLLNWLRLIPDASYVPVRLVPDSSPAGQGPLDLSFATLRSVSPVHLEYLRNMGVGASMSISLVRAEKLWGLIACHHRSPHHVSFAARAACEVIGRVMSLQLSALEEVEARVARNALRGVEAKLVEAMRDAADEPALALLQRGDALLELVGASGAAICTGKGVQTVGMTPSAGQLERLIAWLGEAGSGSVFHTSSLAERFPEAAEYAHLGSGLLALSLPSTVPSYVLWFRPELLRTVTWAGDPTKTLVAGEDGTRLHPRHSFEAWKQVVRGRSQRWRPLEVDAVEDLRRRAIEVSLGQQIARATRAVLHRDETVAILSHDLKSPLQVIQLAAAVLRHDVIGNASAEASIDRVERAVGRMNSLIHDLLDLAQIEAGRFDLLRTACVGSRLVMDALAMLAPVAEAKGVRLAWDGDEAARVDADADRVFQVLSNLLGNAVKFTPSGGSVTVVVRAKDDAVRFSVRDTGPGIIAAELSHIFDRYWQARRVRSVGTGLGLYIAKGIVEAHGGRIWVESSAGAGATFYFTLPSEVYETS